MRMSPRSRSSVVRHSHGCHRCQRASYTDGVDGSKGSDVLKRNDDVTLLRNSPQDDADMATKFVWSRYVGCPRVVQEHDDHGLWTTSNPLHNDLPCDVEDRSLPHSQLHFDVLGNGEEIRLRVERHGPNIRRALQPP